MAVATTASSSSAQVVIGTPTTGTSASPRQSDRPRARVRPLLRTRRSVPPSASPLACALSDTRSGTQLAPSDADGER